MLVNYIIPKEPLAFPFFWKDSPGVVVSWIVETGKYMPRHGYYREQRDSNQNPYPIATPEFFEKIHRPRANRIQKYNGSGNDNAYEAFEKKEEEAKKEALEAKKLEREQHSLKALENLI